MPPVNTFNSDSELPIVLSPLLLLKLFVHPSMPNSGGPPERQSGPVPGQAEVHPDCAGDIVDGEEAAAAVCRNSASSQRLPLPAATGCGDPLCHAVCPSAAPLHPACLPGGLPQASAQLAGARRYCLPLP